MSFRSWHFRSFKALAGSLLAWSACAFLALSALALLATEAGAAQRRVVAPLPESDYAIQEACGMPEPGHASCMALELMPQTAAARAHERPLGRSLSVPVAAANPCETAPTAAKGCYGLRPQDLHSAYNLPTSAQSEQTVAIVDAYNDPNAEANLRVYDQEFGLPECNPGNGCFKQVNQSGQLSPLPPAEGGWAVEISLDIETVHATCESCDILLVEASSESDTSLFAAEKTAWGMGASEISNSWGGEEPIAGGVNERTEASEALAVFNHPGTVITASSGDSGYLNWHLAGEAGFVNFPASSPGVVAVGGTRLSLSTGDVWEGETVWNGAQAGAKEGGAGGSGCSAHFPAPFWQQSLANWALVGCAGRRAVADVSADADPYTGLAIYDTTPKEGHVPGWLTVGGTSLSSPLIASTFALAGGSNGVSYPAQTLYENQALGALHDVQSGSNGECHKADKERGLSGCTPTEAAQICNGGAICLAGLGYDGPTGLGTPDGIEAFKPAGKLKQQISFTSNAPSSALVSGPTYTVSAVASSALPVTLSSATPSVCLLAGTTASFIAPGTCMISASQAGGALYLGAEPQQQSFTVVKAQHVTFSSSAPSSAVVFGPTYTVSAVASSGLAVAFSSATTSICSVAGSTVSFKAVGTCTIQASQVGNAEYVAAEAQQQSFTVAKAPQQITFTSSAPSDATAAGGSAYTVSASANSGLAVAFASETPSVCIVAGATVSFAGAGTCTISAAQTGDEEYNAAELQHQSFAITRTSQLITFTSSAPTAAIVGGAQYTVTAAASSGLAVEFTSPTPSVCTVTGATVSFTGAGACAISAAQSGNGDFASAEMQQDFTVKASRPETAQSFTLVGRPKINRKNGTIKLKVEFQAAGVFTWLFTIGQAKLAQEAGTPALFGKGNLKVIAPDTATITIKPSASALNKLEGARGGLHINALLSFQSGSGSPASLERAITVKLEHTR